MSMLTTKDATMQFGGVVAVDTFNLEVNDKEIVALIGPNGAGKTTAFNMITGVYTPTAGKVFLTDANGQEEDITGMRPDKIVRKGIARTFQNIRLFKTQTVLENVLIGNHLYVKNNFFSAVLNYPFYHKTEKEMREFAMSLLEKVNLVDHANDMATSLPYGKQRRLEIARALATKPKLLLLDEPAAGMNPKETEDLTDFVRQIRDELDLTILMIEHHMQIVMDISDRIYVLDFGKNIAKGTPEVIQNDPKVIEAYLGGTDDVED